MNKIYVYMRKKELDGVPAFFGVTFKKEPIEADDHTLYKEINSKQSLNKLLDAISIYSDLLYGYVVRAYIKGIESGKSGIPSRYALYMPFYRTGISYNTLENDYKYLCVDKDKYLYTTSYITDRDIIICPVGDSVYDFFIYRTTFELGLPEDIWNEMVELDKILGEFYANDERITIRNSKTKSEFILIHKDDYFRYAEKGYTNVDLRIFTEVGTFSKKQILEDMSDWLSDSTTNSSNNISVGDSMNKQIYNKLSELQDIYLKLNKEDFKNRLGNINIDYILNLNSRDLYKLYDDCLLYEDVFIYMLLIVDRIGFKMIAEYTSIHHLPYLLELITKFRYTSRLENKIIDKSMDILIKDHTDTIIKILKKYIDKKLPNFIEDNRTIRFIIERLPDKYYNDILETFVGYQDKLEIIKSFREYGE